MPEMEFYANETKKKSTKNYCWYLTFFNQNLSIFIKFVGKIPGYDLWIQFSIEIYRFINCWYVQNIIHPECVKLNLGGTSFDFNFKLHLDYCLLSNFLNFRKKNPNILYFWIRRWWIKSRTCVFGPFLNDHSKNNNFEKRHRKNIVETNRVWYRFDCTLQNYVISES